MEVHILCLRSSCHLVDEKVPIDATSFLGLELYLLTISLTVTLMTEKVEREKEKKKGGKGIERSRVRLVSTKWT